MTMPPYPSRESDHGSVKTLVAGGIGQRTIAEWAKR
jgi:hypothetical protein